MRIGKLNTFFKTVSIENPNILGNNNVTNSISEYGLSLQTVQTQANLMIKKNLNDVSTKTILRTEDAIRQFYQLACEICDSEKKPFPLAGYNKCFGVAVIPKTKLVLLAISQDKQPYKDLPIRKEMLQFIKLINQYSQYWQFELASIPTKEEYILVRSIGIRSDRQASKEEIEPRSRCVEVSLAIALHKAGRFIRFNSDEVYMMALGGGGFWADKEGSSEPVVPLWGDGSYKRNKKYIERPPLEIEVNLKKNRHFIGYVDIWEPCQNHCATYLKHMLAIAAAGGKFSSHLLSPRGESELCYLQDELHHFQPL